MKNADACACYQNHSSKASEVSRQLAFAGLAFVWLFKIDVAGTFRLPGGLLFPAAMIVLSLSMDLLQYVCATLIWGLYSRAMERMHKDTTEFWPNRMINWPAIAFFWGKLSSITVAYIAMIVFAFRQVAH